MPGWRRLALVVVAACGQDVAAPIPVHRDAAVAAVADAAGPELAARALGMPTLDGFLWRTRGGKAAYSAARRAEHHEDWPAVVAASQQALAADPDHLDAAWLLAVGLAKTGRPADAIAARLQLAVAGNLGKWGPASLVQPALQPFLATPTGAAWRRRLDADRARYEAALAHAIVVIAAGDVYAFDRSGHRWYRMTRTGGAVIAALASPSGRQLAYVTAGHTSGHHGVAILDLDTGHASHPTDLGTAGNAIAWGDATSVWVGPASRASWRAIDLDGKFHPIAAGKAPASTSWLELGGASARVHRLPVAGVIADWDDRALASSIRVGTSNRVITVPSPGLIDGNSAIWSPDHAHLAFVAQLDEQCTPGAISAAAFVADAATGKATELERAAGGLAIEWISPTQVAIAGDHGVRLIGLDGSAAPVDGAAALPSPRRAPRCTAPVAPRPPGDDDDDVGDEAPDAKR